MLFRFLCFFCFPIFLAFFVRFAFSKDLRGSAKRNTLAFWRKKPLLFPKKQGLEGQGKGPNHGPTGPNRTFKPRDCDFSPFPDPSSLSLLSGVRFCSLSKDFWCNPSKENRKKKKPRKSKKRGKGVRVFKSQQNRSADPLICARQTWPHQTWPEPWPRNSGFGAPKSGKDGKTGIPDLDPWKPEKAEKAEKRNSGSGPLNF